jgi:hypothetical protein
MADSSWDNGGQGVPAKTGMPLWGKITLGCGIAFLVVLVTCVGGVAFVANRFKKDPEGFKQKAMTLVVDRVRPDWEDFRAVVEQLRTPEGCQALYAASPGLAKTWPTEAAFLEASSRWHKEVVSAPDLTPDVMEHGGLRINHEMGGQVSVGWSPRSGRAVYVTFEKARKPGDTGPRRVVEVDVR